MQTYAAHSSRLPRAVSLPAVAGLRRWLSWIRKTPKAPLESDVLRLSETSPHLLQDIGFRPAGGSGARIWTDGRHRVAVPGTDAVDRLLRVGRF